MDYRKGEGWMYSLLPGERAIWLTPLLSATKNKTWNHPLSHHDQQVIPMPTVRLLLYTCHLPSPVSQPPIPQASAAEMPLLAGSSSPFTSPECYPAVPLAFCSSREASTLYVGISIHSCLQVDKCWSPSAGSCPILPATSKATASRVGT